ncbi:MAG: GspE/PulE family protein [Candidatus Staskawiczbacteria bacterium]|nr:GspE/PulE family protein [Candidatus Staskawiczbacteria bacterium]
MKLINELFSQGLISEQEKESLEREVEKTGKTEEVIILSKKKIPEDSLFQIKSKIIGVPLRSIKPDQVSADVLELMPEEASSNYMMAPLAKGEDSVEIGMVYPENIAAQNALRFIANQEKFNYKISLITPSDLIEILKQRKTISSETKRALEELNREKGEMMSAIVKKSPGGIIEEEAPIIKMVLVILRHALEGNASDIHIEPSRDKLTVRFRLNGILHSSLFLPLRVHPSIVARIKILSGLKIDENRVPQDGRFSTKINNSDVDFRVSTFPTLYGEKVELRVLDPLIGLKPFEDLGLRGRSLDVVKEAIKRPYGLILSTGPTGSGKTTTQYAILRTLNKDSVNIVTIEDPIEYSIPGVNQSQIKPEINYTFATGLRQILRQDPNIIMVGEIRDEETADLVINAALTGHIVLSTLHTNSSVGVVARLIDMDVRPFLIPSTLRVVISQKLVRLLCPYCKIKTKLVGKMKDYILERIKSLPASAKNDFKISDNLFVYKNKGCEKCNFTGYLGRAGLFEVLSMSDEIAELIQKNPLESLIFKAAQKQGMLTMEQEGIIKVLEGETSIEEIARAVEERE